jgi:hypothetical protein
MNNPQIRVLVFDALQDTLRRWGMSDEQILQYMQDTCPCEECKQKRDATKSQSCEEDSSKGGENL